MGLTSVTRRPNRYSSSHCVVEACPFTTAGLNFQFRDASRASRAKYLLGPGTVSVAPVTSPFGSTETRTLTRTLPVIVSRALRETWGRTCLRTLPEEPVLALLREPSAVGSEFVEVVDDDSCGALICASCFSLECLSARPKITARNTAAARIGASIFFCCFCFVFGGGTGVATIGS